MAGYIVVGAGYHVAFLTLAAAAFLALVVFLLAMPETGPVPQPVAEIAVVGAES